MKPERLLKRAGIPIVALALVLAPAVTWAQPAPAPLAPEGASRNAGDNNTTADPQEVKFSPKISSKRVLPGQSVTHFFWLYNTDNKKHSLDIVASAGNASSNETSWKFSYEPDHLDLEPNTNASVKVTVTAPLLPTVGSKFVVTLDALEKGKSLARAQAHTSYLLP